MVKPLLYIFSGLPGVGKTTIASGLARRLSLPIFRIDTVEHALRELCSIDVQGEGYRLVYRIAAENLRLGLGVIVDCVNPWELTRREWEQTATGSGADIINIEIVCSNAREHRRRVEGRLPDMDGFVLPTWDEVQRRDYQEWTSKRIVVETSGRTAEDCVEEVLRRVSVGGSGSLTTGGSSAAGTAAARRESRSGFPGNR